MTLFVLEIYKYKEKVKASFGVYQIWLWSISINRHVAYSLPASTTTSHRKYAQFDFFTDKRDPDMVRFCSTCRIGCNYCNWLSSVMASPCFYLLALSISLAISCVSVFPNETSSTGCWPKVRLTMPRIIYHTSSANVCYTRLSLREIWFRKKGAHASAWDSGSQVNKRTFAARCTDAGQTMNQLWAMQLEARVRPVTLRGEGYLSYFHDVSRLFDEKKFRHSCVALRAWPFSRA